MNFRIACGCGKHLEVSSDNVGRKGRCPICKAEFIVPSNGTNSTEKPTRKVGDTALRAASQSSRVTAWNDVQVAKIRDRSMSGGNFSMPLHTQLDYQTSASNRTALLIAAFVGGGVLLVGSVLIAAVLLVPVVAKNLSDRTAASSRTEVIQQQLQIDDELPAVSIDSNFSTSVATDAAQREADAYAAEMERHSGVLQIPEPDMSEYEAGQQQLFEDQIVAQAESRALEKDRAAAYLENQKDMTIPNAVEKPYVPDERAPLSVD